MHLNTFIHAHGNLSTNKLLLILLQFCKATCVHKEVCMQIQIQSIYIFIHVESCAYIYTCAHIGHLAKFRLLDTGSSE